MWGMVHRWSILELDSRCHRGAKTRHFWWKVTKIAIVRVPFSTHPTCFWTPKVIQSLLSYRLQSMLFCLGSSSRLHCAAGTNKKHMRNVNHKPIRISWQWVKWANAVCRSPSSRLHCAVKYNNPMSVMRCKCLSKTSILIAFLNCLTILFRLNWFKVPAGGVPPPPRGPKSITYWKFSYWNSH